LRIAKYCDNSAIAADRDRGTDKQLEVSNSSMSLRGFYLASLLLMSALSACSSPEPPEVMNAVRVAQRCEGESDSRYFPFEIFRSLPAKLSDEPRGLGQLLFSMREPSLSCGDEPDSYRILWRHSFTSWGAASLKVNCAPLVREFDHDVEGPRTVLRRVITAACVVLGESSPHI
jgi:hypothetical protein